jgi:hypothetical protein
VPAVETRDGPEVSRLTSRRSLRELLDVAGQELLATLRAELGTA